MVIVPYMSRNSTDRNISLSPQREKKRERERERERKKHVGLIENSLYGEKKIKGQIQNNALFRIK